MEYIISILEERFPVIYCGKLCCGICFSKITEYDILQFAYTYKDNPFIMDELESLLFLLSKKIKIFLKDYFLIEPCVYIIPAAPEWVAQFFFKTYKEKFVPYDRP